MKMFKKFLCPSYRHSACISVPLRSELLHTDHINLINTYRVTPVTEDLHTNHLVKLLQVSCDYALLKLGRQVHAQVIASGINKNSLLDTKILGMYVLCGNIVDAKNMFYQVDLRYTLPWNWMIRGFTIKGMFEVALTFYFKMLDSGIVPDKYTFGHVIKACGGLNSLRMAKFVHDMIRTMGLELDLFAGSSLIKLYANNHCIHDARRLFDEIPQKDSVLWNVMLNGYAKNGDSSNCIETFMAMRYGNFKPNSVTLACTLSVCVSEGLIDLGCQLHAFSIISGLELDSQVANTLLAVYSKCQCLSDARKLFNMMPQSDLVTWNGMISGYVQNGYMSEASHIFNNMISAGVKPDSITFASFLPSVVEYASLRQGKEIHGYIIRHGFPLDVFLESALINVYCKCRNLEMARNIFNESTTVDVGVCTAMISGFVLNGMHTDALDTFRWLLKFNMKPNSLTLASVFPVFASLAALNLGKELHGNIIKHGFDRICHVGSAIADMYAKCGRLDLAYQMFQRTAKRDVVCWNSMISSYSQNARPKEAIDLFCQMGMKGARYDSFSLTAVLSACANLPALHHGKAIHGLIIRGVFTFDVFCMSALIDMYAKCGNMDFARRVFDLMPSKNEVSWNSIIAAYGNHGCLKESLTLFNEMLENGIPPDHVTFLGIISACGHVGHVDCGIHYFRCMTEEYGIPARLEHYACMVDLFGRAGRLNEAFDKIKTMPFSPDAGVWGTLLGACRVHGNVELAEVAARHLLDLDPENSGYYILLANILAEAKKWESVLQIRNLMKERGVQKVPGYSWIEVNNTTHMFVAADGNHPQSGEMYSLLKLLLPELRKEGYVPQPYLPMHPQLQGS